MNHPLCAENRIEDEVVLSIDGRSLNILFGPGFALAIPGMKVRRSPQTPIRHSSPIICETPTTNAVDAPCAGRAKPKALSPEELLDLAAADFATRDRFLARIPADQLRLISPNDLEEMKDLIPIKDPFLTERLVRKKLQAINDTLFQKQEKGIVGRLRGVARTAEALIRLGRGQLKGKYDPDLALAYRLENRGYQTFEAFVEPKRNDVLLIEERGKLPDAVANEIDPTASEKVLEQLAIDCRNSALASNLLERLSKTIPPDALSIVARSGYTLRIAENLEELRTPSQRMKESVGEKVASKIWGGRMLGAFHPAIGEIAVGAADNNGPNDAVRQTSAIHELMHALDFALGEDGRYFSQSGEWRSLFDETTKQGHRWDLLAFPNGYSRTNPQEFFAECATMFLGHHVLWTGSMGSVTTRADLLRANRKAYDLLEKLFVEIVPAANRAGARATAIDAVRYVDRQVEEAAQEVEAEPDFVHLLVLATTQLWRAKLSDDRRDYETALETTRRCKEKVSGVSGLRELMGIRTKRDTVLAIERELEKELTR